MSPFDALILGFIEGITEFLPISSTGHLILANALLGIPESEFVKTFDIAIQLGAIAAAAALYFDRFLNWEILKRVLVAFIPTGIIGLIFYKIVKTYLLGNPFIVISALAIGGTLLIVFEYLHKEDTATVHDLKEISLKNSFLLGIFQSIAIIPGVSRSAATIVGGLFLGVSRVTIVEFSFLLAVPTMAAATGLDLLKNATLFGHTDFLALALGFVSAFIVAAISIRFLLVYVRTHSFVAFGIYRVIVAIAFFLIFLR